MWLRAALGVGLPGMLMIACGGGGESPSAHREPATDQSATEPSGEAAGSSSEPAQEPAEEEPGARETSLVSASPACAPVGSRVVLKLGMTRDQRSVDCYDVNSVQVVFTPEKHAKVTVMGPMSDGFCAIDVEVPKGAESGAIRVEIGRDTFATEASFPVPCP
jgi:hypothetical protein